MAINKKIFDTLIKKASESGIQAISCSYNQTKNQSLEFTNAKIDGTDISVNNSFSFKALVNDKIGVYVVDFYDESMIDDVISTLIDLSNYGKEGKIEYFTKEENKFKNLKLYNKTVAETPIETLKTMGYELSNKIKSKCQLVETTSVSLETKEMESLYVNSLNTHYYDHATESSVVVSATFKQDDLVKSYYEYEQTPDEITTINTDKMIQSLIKNGMDELKSEKIKTGQYKVILSYQPISVILLNAIDHLSGERLTENTSIFKNCFNNESVLSKKLTVRTDSSTRSLTTEVADVDHRPIKDKQYIIKNGVLQTPMYDNEYALKNNTTSNTLVGATYRMKEGKESFEEAIKNIKKGIYVQRISGLNSSMNPLTLSFSCPFEGYYIEDGKLTHKINLSMISGNCKDILKNITKVLNQTSDKYNMFSCEVVVNKVSFTSK